jgi:hypothetical protein
MQIRPAALARGDSMGERVVDISSFRRPDGGLCRESIASEAFQDFSVIGPSRPESHCHCITFSAAGGFEC